MKITGYQYLRKGEVHHKPLVGGINYINYFCKKCERAFTLRAMVEKTKAFNMNLDCPICKMQKVKEEK